MPGDGQRRGGLQSDAENLASVHWCRIEPWRVLGEVEKNTFIALPGKGGHSGLVP